MVGVRKSNRCDNCRIRKKKCDERKPSCSQCIKGGWPCPGYKSSWKFVDENAQLAQYYSKRKYTYGFGPTSQNLQNEDGSIGVQPPLVLRPRRHPHNSSPTFIFEIPRSLITDPLLSKYLYCLGSKVQRTLIPLRLIGSFFDFIPSRLGHNAALDDAISCLNIIYSDENSSEDFSFENKILCRTYVKALSTLRVYLSDAERWLEPETLCASILLHMFELVVNIGSGEWNQLARGTSILIQARGVDRFRTPFERAMLESQIGFVAAQCLQLKKYCFLQDPEWQALLTEDPVFDFHTSQPQSLTLRYRVTSMLVHIPSYRLDFVAAVHNQDAAERKRRLAILKRQVSEREQYIQKFVETHADPLFFPPPISDFSLKSHNGGLEAKYPDIISGIVDCVAHTTLINLSTMLQCLSPTQQETHTSNDRRLLSELCDWAQEQNLENEEKGEEKPTGEEEEILTRRLQRAMTAFEFVQGKSTVAAKPLNFGLSQLTEASSGRLITDPKVTMNTGDT